VVNVETKHYLQDELYKLIQSDESIFEFLQSGSLDGIWYWDLENAEHEWMSPRFWEIFGYDPNDKDHLASEWQDMINPDDLQKALDNFHKHCADPNHPYDQIVRYTHRDGSIVWVRCRGIAIRNSEGVPIRMLGAHTDLTQLKLTEQALLDRTRELEATNRQLEEALASIKTLAGLIPICSHCKNIRDDEGFWNQLEEYLSKHSDCTFTHGICPACIEEHYSELDLEKSLEIEK